MTSKAQKYHILINKDSGSAQYLGQGKLRRLVKDSAIDAQSFRFLGAEELLESFDALCHKRERVLIGGGDGTMKACAAIALKRKSGFGIIPLGTMNLLARDIGVPEDIEEALNCYAVNAREDLFDVGMINNQLFLCCAGIGTIPEASEFREETRDDNAFVAFPRLAGVIWASLEKLKNQSISLNIDGKIQKIRSSSLVISNNSFNEDPSIGVDGLKKESLTDGKLGVYSVSPRTVMDRLRVLSRLALGSWQKDPVVQTWHGEAVSVFTKQHQQLLSLDGETVVMKTPLECRIKPSSLPLLVPMAEEMRSAA